MLPQTEDTRQIGGQTLPSNDVEGGKRSRKPWLGLAIALIAVAALLVSGIWSRVRARTTLSAETAQVGSDRSVGCIAKTNRARPGNHPSRKCTTVHHFADLCAHQRISEEVVFRYWSARQAGATACGDRNAGSRPATPASSQQPVYRAGKSRARRHHQDPISGTFEKQCCIPAGRRQRGRHLQCE